MCLCYLLLLLLLIIQSGVLFCVLMPRYKKDNQNSFQCDHFLLHVDSIKKEEYTCLSAGGANIPFDGIDHYKW